MIFAQPDLKVFAANTGIVEHELFPRLLAILIVEIQSVDLEKILSQGEAMHDIGLDRAEWCMIDGKRQNRRLCPGFQRVVARTACKEIRLSRCDKPVIAVTSEEAVGPVAAEDRIIAA